MEYEPRLFHSDEAVRRIGERLLARTLKRADWTHEAHLAATAWILLERPDILPERDLPGIIRGYNESVGGVNDETQGYHETITQLSIRAVRHALARSEGTQLAARVNALLHSPEGRRDWPLLFYSPELLFSREARFRWVEPDLTPPGPSFRSRRARSGRA
ncbi:MAG TPA: hypothetical protein VEZ20_01730 [Allosphingosinicella sp.]|jgi:hypothetical protein|nr:hypothetical protein [Allosphingosinicella sp.]